MFFDKFDPTALPLEGARNEPRISQWQNFQAAQDAFNYVDAGQASSQVLRDIWEPIVDEVNQTTGSDFWSPTDALNIGIGIGATAGGAESRYRYQAERLFNHIQENSDVLPEEITSLSFERLNELSIERAQQAISDLEFAAEDRPGFLDGAIRFLGGLSAGASDPSNVPYLAIGGAGSKNLLSFAFREAVINAGAEAALQPSVAEWYETIGLPYTTADFFRNVGFAAVAGAGFAVGIRGAARGAELASEAAAPFAAQVRGVPRAAFETARFLDNAEPSLEVMLNNQQLREGIRVLESAGVRLSREAKTALDMAQALDELDAENPGIAPGDHAERVAEAEQAIVNGTVPRIADLAPEEMTASAVAAQPRPTGGVIFEYDPRDIQVDAETFQFKTGGDALGVTERLQGVTEWDPYLAGVITVYEYRDGSTFVADGHQRLGLAKRLLEQNPDANIRISAYRIRETDGITPQEAMVTAAIKNIAEGTGTAIDAARILRLDPDRLTGLPPRSQLVRQARDMMELTDEAFGAIINEVIPANYGAIVGRVLGDRPELQNAAIEVLAKADPANVFQAEAIVRQVREADAEQVTQISLFGEEIVTESLYAERARILDRAFKALRRDRAAFESLTRNADRIEGEGGNVLDRQANERRAEQNAQIIALLQTLANRKGPLSDALSNAAREARTTGSYIGATNGFVDAVRRSITEGDFDRISSSELGRVGDAPAENSRRSITEDRAVEEFDEPNGLGAEDQAGQIQTDMFGAEPEAPAAPRAASPIEEDTVPLEEIRMPIDDTLPPDQIRAEVQRLTQENIPIVRALIEQIDQRFGTKSGDNVKDLAKVIQKANRPSILAKKPWHKVSHIRDSYRFKTVIDDIRDIPAIFDVLLESGIRLVKVDTGKLFEPKEWGWRIIAFDLRMPNGQLVEWYLPIRELELQKKAEGHLLFEEWRNKTPEEINNEMDAYMATIQRSFEGYDKAFQASLGRMGISRSEAEALWRSSESSMLDAARKSASSSGITMSAGERALEIQEPSRVRMAQVPPGQKTIAREVPSSMRAKDGDVIAQPPIDEPSLDIDIGTRPVKPDLLFDDIETDQLMEGIDLDEEISLDLAIDPETGEAVAQTMTMRDVKRMVDEEDAIIQRLEFCTR
jgi:GNAT superfamily N-acetyltransferase